MPNQTAKSHKSRKTEGEPKPRQRTISAEPVVNPLTATLTLGSSPVQASSSLVPATTASGPSDITSGISTEAPKELPREEQFWYRRPDSIQRKQAEKIVVLRAAGHQDEAIAKRMKTTAPNVRQIIYLARKNGWLDGDDEPVDLEAELANNIDRKLVRNLSASLDGQMTNWQTHEMTVAGLKGRGMFKNHEKSEGGEAQMTVVAIRVEMPPIGADDQVVDEGNIGGQPAYLDGEVSDGPVALQSGYVGSDTQDSDPGIVSRVAPDVSGPGGLV